MPHPRKTWTQKTPRRDGEVVCSAAVRRPPQVLPTLMELVGLPVPPQCDGRALTRWLHGEDAAAAAAAGAWKSSVFWEFDFRGEAAAADGLNPYEASLVCAGPARVPGTCSPAPAL